LFVKREPVDTGRLVTNAARMQAGLAPLKPRSFYQPSRVAARAPSTSILPVAGTIEVKDGSGNFVGFISNTIGQVGYGITNTQSNAIAISFTAIAPFNIAISNQPYPYLGFAGSSLEPDSDVTNAMTATNPTAPGAIPQNVGNAAMEPYFPFPMPTDTSESAIWSYDASTQSLTAQWINPDGSQPPTHFFYSPDVGLLGMIQSPAQLVGAYEVFLTFV